METRNMLCATVRRGDGATEFLFIFSSGDSSFVVLSVTYYTYIHKSHSINVCIKVYEKRRRKKQAHEISYYNSRLARVHVTSMCVVRAVHGDGALARDDAFVQCVRNARVRVPSSSTESAEQHPHCIVVVAGPVSRLCFFFHK